MSCILAIRRGLRRRLLSVNHTPSAGQTPAKTTWVHGPIYLQEAFSNELIWWQTLPPPSYSNTKITSFRGRLLNQLTAQWLCYFGDRIFWLQKLLFQLTRSDCLWHQCTSRGLVVKVGFWAYFSRILGDQAYFNKLNQRNHDESYPKGGDWGLVRIGPNHRTWPSINHCSYLSQLFDWWFRLVEP